MSFHYQFKQGDTVGQFVLVVLSGLGSTISTADAVLNARNQNRENVVDAADVTISDAEQAADDTYGATFTADLPDGFTDQTGFYWLEIQITYADLSVQTIPTNVGTFTAEVVPNYAAPEEEEP